MFGWHKHKWTKWEQYQQVGQVISGFDGKKIDPIPYSQRRQRRHCEGCGKEQDELVRNG